ncbi:hypothetical protein RN001_005615 [Aquatica leii]|uniref:Uncharacterized protein n=1 Tax=Aquatica leii TaxID=1421715 RepID=A0AAN7PH98_9COLE|nr:hypothetical protein RN001_005615 [Aquatica leii]
MEIRLDDTVWLENNGIIDAEVQQDGTLVISNSSTPKNVPTQYQEKLDGTSPTILEEKLAKPGTSHEIQEVSPLTEVQSNKLETPIKQIENGNTQYPTPFKSALFWPNRTERVKRKITDSSKSKLPKLQPTVAISDFMEYQRRLKEEKQKKEEEKKRRTEERKKKIDEKQKIQEEKKKKSEKKIRKRADIQGKHEERDQEQREENTTRNIEENSDKDKHEPDNKTDQELNQNVAENKENVEYIPNIYVIVNYDGQLYPGKILEVSEESVKVTAMAGCGCLFKWPEKENILDYFDGDIICKINPPILVNKRGVYKVSEQIRLQFRRNQSSSGRPQRSTFKRKLFLLKLANSDFLPGNHEKQFLKERGLGLHPNQIEIIELELLFNQKKSN